MTPRHERAGFRVSDDYVAATPGADPSATELVINVFLTAELLFARMDRLLSRFDLSRRGFNLLHVVRGAGGPLSPSEIGERLIVTTATITGVVDTLEGRGLVTRTRDVGDRRRVLVAVTAEGSALLDRISTTLVEREKAWSAGLRGPARERLVGDLGTLQDHLRALPREP